MYTKKKLSKGALAVHPGKEYSSATDGWEAAYEPGSGDAIAYDAMAMPMNEQQVIDNAEVDGLGFESDKIQVGTSCNPSFSGQVRAEGLGQLLYSAIGYECPAEPGDGGSPVDATGGYYTHIYEIDPETKEPASYTTSDLSVGSPSDYDASDRKNRIVTIGKKLGLTDATINAMISELSITGSVRDSIKWSCESIGRVALLGDYGSDTWTFPTGAKGSENVLTFDKVTATVGPVGSTAEYCIKDFTIDIETPLLEEQCTESGLYNTLPVTTAMTVVSGNFTVNKYSSSDFQTKSQAWTDVGIAIEATSGSYKFNVYLPKCKITSAAPSEDDVASQAVNFTAARWTTGENPFTTQLSGLPIVHYSPAIITYTNTSSQNEMRRR